MNSPPGPPAARLEEIAGAVGGAWSGLPMPAMITGVCEPRGGVPATSRMSRASARAEVARGIRAAAFVVSPRRSSRRRKATVIVAANPASPWSDRRGLLHRAPPGAARRPRGDPRRRRRDRPRPSIWPFVTLGNRVRLRRARRLLPRRLCRRRGGDRRRHGPAPMSPCSERCSIGARVIVHSGAVIGSDGFGYVQQDGRHHEGAPDSGTVVHQRGRRGAGRQRDASTARPSAAPSCGAGPRWTTWSDRPTTWRSGAHRARRPGRHLCRRLESAPTCIGRGTGGLADHLEVGDRAMVSPPRPASFAMFRRHAGARRPGASARPEPVPFTARLLLLPGCAGRLRRLQQRVKELEARRRHRPRRAAAVSGEYQPQSRAGLTHSSTGRSDHIRRIVRTMPSRSHFRDDVVTRRSRARQPAQPLQPPRRHLMSPWGDVGIAAEGVRGGA